jgi:hypothetical protein
MIDSAASRVPKVTSQPEAVGFYKTSDGRLHSGRIAGTLYIVGLLPGCGYFQHVDRLCVLRILATAGWWLSLCDQRQPRTFADLIWHPRRLVGFIIIIAALAGQYYVIGRH